MIRHRAFALELPCMLSLSADYQGVITMKIHLCRLAVLIFPFIWLTFSHAEENAPWGTASVQPVNYKPQKVVYDVAVSSIDMFENVQKKYNLASALDKINDRWGEYVITPAKMLGMANKVIDRISFGGIKELEEELRKHPEK